MFTFTEAAKEEIIKRLEQQEANHFIRLQMRKSCFMKVKLTLEAAIESNDRKIEKEGLTFIIDNGECHYFNNKKLDFIPDQTGFKQFEVL
ncbi:Fe-S cluster assembly iron-binding protein IscA [Neobacillus niacini]|uniref:iron-sulfur cluster biosynthesis family protein n=1 Tax=Neobacillus niacini TaxID=86668 RepID=UPI0028646BA8|nr:iron-sulfur cluster biosynthesis family protein [Neobacillus niacini]MDR7078488.1 Fe-S cluster assembly iron-binding protein IscA [Neobacillus niacini]